LLIKIPHPHSPRYKSWEEFTKTGKLTKVSNSPIYASWQRCLELNLNPSDMNISKKLPKGDLSRLFSNNIMLVKASESSLSILENSIHEMPYALILCDPQGNILYKSGNGLVSDYFDQANLVIGGNCSESEIGTTAPGIALVEKKPIIVLQEEHYSKIYHWCCCSAFPIFDIEKGLVGCIDITFLNDQADKMNFLHGLNIATVKSIQSSLHIHQLLEKMGEARDIIESTSNLTKNNILIIDRSGRILLANQQASNLLKVPVYKLTGEHYQEILESDAIVSCFSTQKKLQGIAKLKSRDALDKNYFAQARPLHNHEGVFIGSVVTIDEEKKQWPVSQSSHEINYTFQALIGESPGMTRAIKLARRFADTDMPILLQGDTGTGKEVFAHAIHNHSNRRDGPFIPVNCAAIPHDLLESELFGYSKGAFTGALREGKKGKFEMAEGGTLFLDEINSMPIGAQGKLLRAVEDGEIVQLGDHVYKHVNVRIIAASSANLDEEFQKGHFRKDLFYRLSLVRIFLPNLKSRIEDLEPLVHYFLEKFAGKLRRKAPRIHPLAMQSLYAHNWPGNVRELENCIKFATHLIDSDIIMPEHLPDYLREGGLEEHVTVDSNCLIQMDKTMILHALESSNGSIGEAAKKLGISRSTIYRKRRQYGLVGKTTGH
jgi:sigma-54 dependent transcriptional regulator, acetoin dehydrogenase operon transcriptional activator AcoR